MKSFVHTHTKKLIGIVLLIVTVGFFAYTYYSNLNQPFLKQKEEAGTRGLNFLLQHKDEMKARSVSMNFIKFYKVIPDEKISSNLSKIIDDNRQNVPRIDPNIDIQDEKYLKWNVLRQVISELLERKCEGQEFKNEAQRIKEYIETNSEELFPTQLLLSEKLVAAYLLKELGIYENNMYQGVIAHIRAQKVSTDPANPSYIPYLYSLTHVILTDSDYYSRYLDSKKYPTELSGFKKAIEVFSAGEITENEGDILSEILISLKLLRIPPDEKTNKLYRKIMELQNRDGSFGKSKTLDSAKIHHTTVASLALLNFTSKFRTGKFYCSRAWR